MATLLGDFGATHSTGFHTMITTQGLPYSQQHQDSSQYRSNSHSRDQTPRRQSPTRQRSSPRYSAQGQKERDASRLPSPPDSTSSSGSAVRSDPSTQDGQSQAYMESSAHHSAQGFSDAVNTVNPIAPTPPASQSQSIPGSSHANPILPSPASDSGETWTPASPVDSTVASPNSSIRQTTIHVRDLAHVESLARTHITPSGTEAPPLQAMKYEISGMPIGDIIEMVAALLTKITTTNDLQQDTLNRNAIERNASHVKQAQAQNDGSATEHSMSPLSSSVLAFHGKNVPAITILSYLSRIHKYCPTTFEVFLSLLVYFDRMTERINEIVMKDQEAKKLRQQSTQPIQADVAMKDDDSSDDSDTLDEDIVDDSDSEDGQNQTAKNGTAALAPAMSQPTFFVVDSFNIHRLIIAGVTCASKFFSDVFYTNSRYAKV